MKVKDLKALLDKEDDERLVVLASDRGGDRFSPLYSVSFMKYDEETREIGFDRLTEDEYAEEDFMSNGVNALVLTPLWQK